MNRDMHTSYEDSYHPPVEKIQYSRADPIFIYKEYFGFSERPFSISPDPRYLYMSEQHREALAHLIYGINSDGGFVLLTGEVGTGKTTVCRCLLEQIPENTTIAFIFNPKITVEELLACVCDEFGIHYPEGNTSIKVFVDLINSYLLAARSGGSRAVLIIDEAQNLQTDVLEQLRLLTNLETSQEKLLQIILLGQPELREMLSRPELRQLDQRITARYHLGPLARREVGVYASHRLKVAGFEGELFPKATVNKLYRLSGGVPRLINVLCDRSLIGACVQKERRVSKRTLIKAAREVFGEKKDREVRNYAPLWVVAGVLTAAVLVILRTVFYNYGLPNMFKKGEMQAVATHVGESRVTGAGLALPLESPSYDDLAQWLFGQTGKEGEDVALEELFGLWGVDYRPGEESSACRQAREAGLRCLAAYGGLDDLRRLDRPAVLEMRNSEGGRSYATLEALHGQKATLAVRGETREIPLVWIGTYTILWRPPPDYQYTIYPGDRGSVVLWLEKQMGAVYRDGYFPRDNRVYDDMLVWEVKKFQKEEGLAVDGIVGPQTIIRLNSRAGEVAPLLSGTREGV